MCATEKECFKCKEVLPLSLFYKHARMKDGHLNKCIECTKQDSKDSRRKSADYYRAYDAYRFKNDPRVKERHRRYLQTDKGKASQKKSKQKWLENNVVKRAANVIVRNAIRDGRLTKPDTCSVCGAGETRIHGHHDDYAKPLEVTWLCPACHKQWHKENGEGANG